MKISLTSKDAALIEGIFTSWTKAKTEWWDKTTIRKGLVIDKQSLERDGYGVLQLVQVRNLIETRDLELCRAPYRGESIPSECIRLDPWEIESFPNRQGSNEPSHDEVAPLESRAVMSCLNCSRRGRVTCSGCRGQCEVKCANCVGTGQERRSRDIPYIEVCQSCDGRGGKTYSNREFVQCSSCRGGGRLNKTRKEEYYVPCGRCCSTGMVKCDSCKGSGEVTCKVCEGQKELLEFVRYTRSIGINSAVGFVGPRTAVEVFGWFAKGVVDNSNAQEQFKSVLSDLKSSANEAANINHFPPFKEELGIDLTSLDLNQEIKDTIAKLNQETIPSKKFKVHFSTISTNESGYLISLFSGQEKIPAIAIKTPPTIYLLGGAGTESRHARQLRLIYILVLLGCDNIISATSRNLLDTNGLNWYTKWSGAVMQIGISASLTLYLLSILGNGGVGAFFIFAIIIFGIRLYKAFEIKKYGVQLPNGVVILGKSKDRQPLSYSNRNRWYVYFKYSDSDKDKSMAGMLIEVMSPAVTEGHWASKLKHEERVGKLVGMSRKWAFGGPFSTQEQARNWRPWGTHNVKDEVSDLEKWFSKNTVVGLRSVAKRTFTYIPN
jgi:hypothetical protein